MCDVIACEEDWALEYRTGQKAYREPLTMCLDPTLWHPDIEIPADLILPRVDDELIVMHAHGNAAVRRDRGRDIKGTGAIIAAVEQLRNEGRRVRLELVSNVVSAKMRYLQVQADIVVDQLNYGRYGAQAREAMMLGRPTICNVNARQAANLPLLRSLAECPLIHATESTLVDVLRRVLESPEERAVIGNASRKYALKWHSADACAERYEAMYDRLVANLPPEADTPVMREAA